jgi:hypothetical protein
MVTRRSVACEAHLALAPDAVYHYWNERLLYPQFIPGLNAVEISDEVWSRWFLDDGSQVDVELTDNVLHQYVAWRLHDQHRERVSVWVQGPGESSSLLRLELSWRDDLDGLPRQAQQAKVDKWVDRFRAFAEADAEQETQAAGRRNRPWVG